MKVDMVMPQMGESIAEATILKWLKKPGDAVEKDEIILEISTDKVDSEIPAPSAGVIVEILFNGLGQVDSTGSTSGSEPTSSSTNRTSFRAGKKTRANSGVAVSSGADRSRDTLVIRYTLYSAVLPA